MTPGRNTRAQLNDLTLIDIENGSTCPSAWRHL